MNFSKTNEIKKPRCPARLILLICLSLFLEASDQSEDAVKKSDAATSDGKNSSGDPSSTDGVGVKRGAKSSCVGLVDGVKSQEGENATKNEGSAGNDGEDAADLRSFLKDELKDGGGDQSDDGDQGEDPGESAGPSGLDGNIYAQNLRGFTEDGGDAGDF